MTYEEALEYLYQHLPAFHLSGKKAFKPGLGNTRILLEHLGNPHLSFPCIHVAGTNGKGSTSHMLAAILQQAGYKTGLYTSPHLQDYTERIRINGQSIDPQQVAAFVDTNRMFIHSVDFSFFEISVGLAFHEFQRQQVDIAVIEVGLGGRLDSTNIITPLVSVITNIGWDHTDVLGDTLEKIAGEKAGIIKERIPVMISERQPGIDTVFTEKAKEMHAPIVFASDRYTIEDDFLRSGNRVFRINGSDTSQELRLDLTGDYQRKNILGVLETIRVLNTLSFPVSDEAIQQALPQVVSLTGLKGRWQQLSQHPDTYCDTGHNESGITEVLKTISSLEFTQLWFILGFVKDKDLSKVLPLYPQKARFIFCQANNPRSISAKELADLAAEQFQMQGLVIEDVNEAMRYAREHADTTDLIVVGGSTFVVAEIEEL